MNRIATADRPLHLVHLASPLILALVGGAAATGLAGCGGGGDAEDPPPGAVATPAAGDHEHGDGADHDHDDDAGDGGMDEHEHGADDVLLGTVTIGDLAVTAWQGHGELAPGKELHLVVKIEPDDRGASTIRTWIGTEDRLRSAVARAEYAPSHGDYDAHAMAPIPLPEDARWWIEVERPDGEILTGSIEAK